MLIPEIKTSTKLDDDPKTGISALTITNRQESLISALELKEQKLSKMFIGVLISLQSPNNPEYLVHAAHSLRELMEKLPRYIDVQTANKFDIKGRINVLLPSWKDVIKKWSENIERNHFEKPIDKTLSDFISKCQCFFCDYEKYSPSKQKEFEDTISALDGAEICLPKPLLKLEANKWKEIYTFFQGVAHHGKTTDILEFGQWLSAFERILSEKMIQPTFEVQDTLDDIIKRGELS